MYGDSCPACKSSIFYNHISNWFIYHHITIQWGALCGSLLQKCRDHWLAEILEKEWSLESWQPMISPFWSSWNSVVISNPLCWNVDCECAYVICFRGTLFLLWYTEIFHTYIIHKHFCQLFEENKIISAGLFSLNHGHIMPIKVDVLPCLPCMTNHFSLRYVDKSIETPSHYTCKLFTYRDCGDK